MPVEVVPHVEFLEATDILPKIRHFSLELTDVKIAMAYIRRKGFQLFSKSLHLASSQEFLNSGLRLKFLVGLSEQQFITDYEPLQHLVRIKTELGPDSRRLQIRYYNDPRFHPKMYILTGRKDAAVIVGSSNMTKGGFERNKEANLLLEGTADFAAVQNARGFFEQLWRARTGLRNAGFRVLLATDIDENALS